MRKNELTIKSEKPRCQERDLEDFLCVDSNGFPSINLLPSFIFSNIRNLHVCRLISLSSSRGKQMLVFYQSARL